ncbi:MAG: UDP-galactopyranose mutase, partial [uncultured Rubellimicrobium sp.]
AHHLHRAHRPLLRLPLRATALSQPELPARDAGPAAVPGRGGRQLPGRGRALYPDHRVQAPHRADAPADLDHLRIPVGRRRPVLPDPAAREPGAVQEVRGAGPGPGQRDLPGAARHLPLLQHGPGRRSGAGHPSPAGGADGRDADRVLHGGRV